MGDSKTVPVVVMQGMRHIYWLKSEGDLVHEGEPIASMEAGDESRFIAAPVDGTLEKILIGQGGTTISNKPVCYIRPQNLRTFPA